MSLISTIESGIKYKEEAIEFYRKLEEEVIEEVRNNRPTPFQHNILKTLARIKTQEEKHLMYLKWLRDALGEKDVK